MTRSRSLWFRSCLFARNKVSFCYILRTRPTGRAGEMAQSKRGMVVDSSRSRVARSTVPSSEFQAPCTYDQKYFLKDSVLHVIHVEPTKQADATAEYASGVRDFPEIGRNVTFDPGTGMVIELKGKRRGPGSLTGSPRAGSQYIS